eukprot:gene27666-35702_t
MSAAIARDVLFFAATSWTMATSLATYGRYSQRMLARRLSSTVKDTKSTSPNGAWLVGEHQPAPYANKSFKSYLSSDLRKAGGLYSLAISAVIPRPIALVTSQDKDGNINCAPYSYFNLVSHDPPLIIVGNSLNVRSATKKKDTLRNIEETESANHCSGAFPHDINEMDKAGLSSLPSDVVKPPRVGNAAIQLECETFQLIPVSNDDNVHSSTLVLGKILKFHVLEDVLTPESNGSPKPVVDWRKLRPIARMGGDTYTVVDNGFDISRPK